MDQAQAFRTTMRGISFLILGLFIFSLQDIVVKLIGGNYPILEIVTFRSLVALPLTVLLFRWEGGRGLPAGFLCLRQLLRQQPQQRQRGH